MRSRSNIDSCRKFSDKVRFQHQNKLRQGNAIGCIGSVSICILAIYLREKEKRFSLPGVRIEPCDALYLGDTHLNAYIYSRLFFLEKCSEELKPDFATFAKNQCFTNFQPLVEWPVEWRFGKICQLFAFLDFKKNFSQ